ncbi:MAG TPA: cobalamin-dependent protein [Candidatus Binataceae bacterium]|jgi:methanogenic corrinoid protein MtbC1|nr:cobalamin-dependent protein [Candidatus Binataceae bacterium]
MDEKSDAAKELRSVMEAVAQAAVARDYARRPALLAKYGERGRARYLEDTRYHQSYLADAVSFGRSSIFKDYLGWVSAVLSARGVASEELLENLRCMREVLSETLSPGSSAIVLAVFDAGVAGATSVDRWEQALPADGLTARYVDFLLRGQRQAALELVQDAIRAGMGIRDIWLRVFQDSQYEVGRLWQSNKISIAQEHYCTAATQMIMAHLYSHIFSAPRIGRVLVTACAPGEIHELGMRMVADLFEMEGWDTYHLGANLPAAALVAYVAQRKPDLLGLSATMTFHLAGVAAMVRELRANQDTRGVRIMVGGHAFNREPDLWRDIGADEHACNGADASVAAARLTASAEG